MTEAGRPTMSFGDSAVVVELDGHAIHELLHHLVDSLNTYVRVRKDLDDPIVLMGVLNLFRGVINQQAEAMQFSPEQRESFCRVVVSNLSAALQADTEEYRIAWKPEAQPKPAKE